MPAEIALKSRILDQKDREILMILQENGRESITQIAKKVGRSIDSVYNRVKVMIEKGIFRAGIFIDPRVIGFPLVVDVKIKLRNVSTETKEKFIHHLIAHPRVTSLFSITGNYDFLCVLIAKDTNELEEVATQIRNKYEGYIADWETMLFLKTYKLEKYDLTTKETSSNS